MKRWQGNLLTLIIVLVFCFLFLELAVRLLWHGESSYGYPVDLHIVDLRLGFRYTPNYTGYFASGAYGNTPININDKGLRDVPHDYARTPRTVRIVVFGDSVTFGSGIRAEKTYVKQLEELLRADGYPVEIVNMGVAGYSINQIHDYYFLEGKRYSPDIVLYQTNLNDLVPANISQLVTQGPDADSPRRTFVNWVSRYSKCFKWAYWLLQGILQERAKERNDLYFEQLYERWNESLYPQYYPQFSALLGDLAANLSRQNVTFIVAVFPYTEQLSMNQSASRFPQEQIRRALQMHNATVIDLYDQFKRDDYLDLYLPGDNGHPNEQGHAFAAQYLYLQLRTVPLIASSRERR